MMLKGCTQLASLQKTDRTSGMKFFPTLQSSVLNVRMRVEKVRMSCTPIWSRMRWNCRVKAASLLGLSTEITTVTTSEGLRSFGDKCSDEILANQRRTTIDVRERESTLVHDEASQARSKDLPFCQGRSDTTPVSDGTILPVSARKDEHLLKGPNGSASERRQEIGAEILDSKTRSAPDLEDQKRVKTSQFRSYRND